MPENLVLYREKLFCVGKSRGETFPKMEMFRRLVKKPIALQICFG